ncbi:hypothetical protein KR093_000125 [Drosophila rubida]|uniref:Uncharacterized protein n=1 Tax=Drosophila rubida TaxID=30044 RepID=A0AAD4K5M8_9MUSC|nr:hypothetical protein KR093_000125 [Drosophila rubida]
MLNDSKGIDVGTTTEATDDCSELDNLERQAEVLPSGSRTLDRRLNPDAPDFVPGLGAATRLLAVKIVNELSDYPRWSNAASELDTYGPRYDSIWRESCLRAQVEAEAEALNASGGVAVGVSGVGIASDNRIEIVGDIEELSPATVADKRSKATGGDVETASVATTTVVSTKGRCCANCALM